jgi:hypothetical protein
MTLGKFRLAAGFTALLLAVAALVSPAAASGKPIVRVRGSSVAESAGYATVTLRVRKKARSRIKVRFRTVSGTAVAGRDFVAASGHVTIRKHKRSATIRLRILDDAVHEGTEYFYVKLASKASTLKPRRVAVVIGDDDPPPSSGTTLTGTVSYQLVHDEYFGDLELGSPGEEHWTTTLTLHVSLHQLGDGEWYDDGTGYWSFVSENKLWFRRGRGWTRPRTDTRSGVPTIRRPPTSTASSGGTAPTGTTRDR